MKRKKKIPTFKENRLKAIRKNIRKCGKNLSIYNYDDFKDFNFNILFKSLNNLLEEISSEMKKEEIDDCLLIKKTIEVNLEKYPTLKDNHKGYISFNDNNFLMFCKSINEYQKLIEGYAKDKYFIQKDNRDIYFCRLCKHKTVMIVGKKNKKIHLLKKHGIK